MNEHQMAWTFIRKDGSISLRVTAWKPPAKLKPVGIMLVPFDDYNKMKYKADQYDILGADRQGTTGGAL